MSHISKETGRNKRESGKLARRNARSQGRGNQIRKVSDGTGRPAERRIDQKRRRITGG